MCAVYGKETPVYYERSVMQRSDGLSSEVSNIIRRFVDYEVAAYMHFSIITFFHIL